MHAADPAGYGARQDHGILIFMHKRLKRLLEEIKSEVSYTSEMTGRQSLAPRVLKVMSEVPREQFVARDYARQAYYNGPLPIGYGQTISQPFIVALMTDLLELKPHHTVLEIGTGSGYQAAILASLCKQVYSVEYIPELAEDARNRFQQLGYGNIEVMTGNGYDGWARHAPYDAIMVTAAATHIPEPLLEQLGPGGRMVIPLGQPHRYQELTLVRKDEAGKIWQSDILGVAFVPLQAEHRS